MPGKRLLTGSWPDDAEETRSDPLGVGKARIQSQGRKTNGLNNDTNTTEFVFTTKPDSGRLGAWKRLPTSP